MSQPSIPGSLELGKAIKLRRSELHLTIEEAASRAGVGTKTWSRYEAGGAIRKDKSKGICKALNWHNIPENDTDTSNTFDLNEYKKHKVWSPYLADNLGEIVAVSFSIGSDILLDHVKEDLQEISSMPRGTHIGELGISMLESVLPSQFLMHYDYDFLYLLKTTISHFRAAASAGIQIIAHSVMEELVLYLIMEEAIAFMEIADFNIAEEDASNYNWDSWAFDIFDDMDVVTFLYSGMYLDSSNPYHFGHWLERQFYYEQSDIEEVIDEDL